MQLDTITIEDLCQRARAKGLGGQSAKQKAPAVVH
jgi:hypothetical protein